jgi:GTP cyclohydrolase III
MDMNQTKYTKSEILAHFEKAGARCKKIFTRKKPWDTFIMVNTLTKSQVRELCDEGKITEYIDCDNYRSYLENA